MKTLNINKLKILLVDDDPSILEAVSNRLLELFGGSGKRVDIITANNGLVAQEILETNRSFDLIITDGNMEYCSGVELLKYCNNHDVDIPAVAFHGGKIDDNEFSDASPSCSAVVIKPNWGGFDNAVLEALSLSASR